MCVPVVVIVLDIILIHVVVPHDSTLQKYADYLIYAHEEAVRLIKKMCAFGNNVYICSRVRIT